MKYANIYTPRKLDAMCDVQTLIEYRNAFALNSIAVYSVVIGRFVNLPACVLAHYNAMINKQGRETIKKLNNMIGFGGITAKNGRKLDKTAKFRDLLISDCFYCVGAIGIDPIAVFPFGAVFDSADMSKTSMQKYMESAIAWLPVKPQIEIIEVKK